MIICFSGEGNSLDVAHKLAELLPGENLFIPPADMLRDMIQAAPTSTSNQIIWVFPVYSWGMPPVVARLIRNIQNIRDTPVTKHYMVATCGDDAGYTHRRWRKLISSRGWSPAGAFTVIMPNTYVCMKGFDVDSEKLEQQKLAASKERIADIARKITQTYEGTDVTRGKWPYFKSYVIYPWFVKYCMNPKGFHVADNCTRCGLCSRSCPMSNISMSPMPVWGKQCAFCLRCYHICPAKAVAYGKTTIGKGHYLNKSLSILRSRKAESEKMD